MTAPDKIWLDPECVKDGTDCQYDQCWHAKDPGPCDECGMMPTEYTRTAARPVTVDVLRAWIRHGASPAAEMGMREAIAAMKEMK